MKVHAHIIIHFVSKVYQSYGKNVQTKCGLLWRWLEKTGYRSSILLSSDKTAIGYFKPVNCKVELMVHCSIMCNSFYGSHSFVCLCRGDTVYCLCFWISTSVWRKVITWLCYILFGMIRPSFFVSVPETENIAKVFTVQRLLGLHILSFT